MTVRCQRDGRCGKEWPRDPVLEVPCPSCNAPVGVKCRRPSGHRCDPHAPRDILADQQGHYGTCPLGLCGLENVEKRARAHHRSAFADSDLFDGMEAMERSPKALAAALAEMGEGT
ncbi:MAG: hypothetical protein AAFN79_12330 [Pseudomonadota bacterium]